MSPPSPDPARLPPLQPTRNAGNLSRDFTLGATASAEGTTFALWAPHAFSCEVALFDGESEKRFPLQRYSDGIWRIHLPGIGVGQKYGYRIDGPWDPANGFHFNPAKLLIDPYCHLLDGVLTNDSAIFAHQALDSWGAGEIGIRSSTDSAAFLPKSVVTSFNGVGDLVENQREIRRPEIPWSQTIIYEAHVEGLTKLNLEIPKALRGTYKALSHPLVIKHLKDLGVTTLELLPIQAFVTEPAIAARGRENYWGYNPIAFSAPHHGFAATDNPITELQDAVDALHDAGIEVILDLVYNHTAEGGKDGPLLSMKGIDARGFYHHSEDGSLQDFTGCGNTVKASHPVVASMIIDSLLWWSEVIGVDGFRFDLTTSLSRESRESNRISLIDAISTHPILSRRKLIAEPWDVAGYSLGQFPPPWREWNDRFRDGVRSFWLSSHAEQRSVGVADLARRISGSDDIFAGRGPDASINFITAHDGFTLHDLVTFQVKENSPNGENNRDGSEKNLAWNIGFEGETEDRYINQLRHRLKKSLAGTLLLSAGVPMLVMGDELSRSQNGSNNAFTIDRNRPVEAYENFAGGLPLPWGNYQSEIARDLMESIARLTEIRSKYLNHLISEFFTGGVDTSTQRKDIAWFDINGKELDHNDWHDQSRDHLSIYFSAHRNQGLLVLLNASLEERDFQLPQSEWGDSYRCIFDSSLAIKDFEPQIRGAGEKIDVAPLALHAWLVLIHTEK